LRFPESSGAGKPHLFVGRLGETNGQLATGRLDGDQPWFMPMATQLVFHSTREGITACSKGMWIATSRPDDFRRPTKPTAFVTPCPAPDGRHIVFASAATGVSQIYVMDIEGTHRQQLTFDKEPSYFPAWAPSGDDVLFVRGDPLHSTTQLLLMRLHRMERRVATAAEA
jgi:Tol biopolymer transport system component